MKSFIVTLFLVGMISNLWAGDSLQAMQSMDIGFATSFQDYSTWSNVSLQASTIARVNPNVEVFGKIPLVQHKLDYGSKRDTQTGIGDLSLGIRATVLRSLFVEDIYPTVSFISGVKLPTGTKDFQPANLYQTRSGNGLVEPLAGVSLSKEYYDWVGSLDLSYTRLQGSLGDSFIEDNQINLTETFSCAVSRDWQLGVGSNQLWSFGRRLNHMALADNTGRNLNFFGFVNYFITPFTTLGAHFDSSMEGYNHNQPASRTASVLVRYGFY